jgi:hypothetical protein
MMQGGLTVRYDGAIRASDSDRESVVEILRQAYAEGRLDLAEFDERTTAGYAARTWAQLRELTRDLPADADLGGSSPARPAAALAGPLPGSGPGQRVRQPDNGSVFVPFLPVVLFWIILAGAIHISGLVMPAIILLFLWLRLARRHYHGAPRPGGPPPRPGGSPPRPGGGPA